MNNSFDRILTGLIATLRQEIIPKLEGEFVRGQAYGVIYMLEFLRLRASWSPAFLTPQLEALDELASALAAIPGFPAAAPRPLPATSSPTEPDAMEMLRNAGDDQVSQLIDWLGSHGGSLDRSVTDSADQAVRTYIRRQLRHEIQTSARPMFAEISLGKEEEKTERQ
jgi:hypothetical protein